MKKIIICIMFVLCLMTNCRFFSSKENTEVILGGFSEETLKPIEGKGPYYIAGYKQGQEITGVLDYQCVRAFYLSYFGEEVLMISVDCIGLTSNYVEKIRKGIKKDCNINVMSTHTHAGIDTMGLWGGIALDGKNEAFMNQLVGLAIKAGNEAISNACEGKLTYGQIKTEGILEDSRDPYVYDENIYQLRFIPSNNSSPTRMMFFGAHAESLRGDNTLLSADFPGEIAQIIKEKTGDNFLFFNGAIGGLIMTKVFDEEDLVNNMKITAQKISEYLLKIEEKELKDKTLKQTTIKFKAKMENTLYIYYKFLGILKNKTSRNFSTGEYYLHTEISLLQIGEINFLLIPGEIFPELVWGGSYQNNEVKHKNPLSLSAIAEKYNINNLIIIGLANDEVGYIVPPSDYMLNDKYPYINDATDSRGENHYEETNSLSIDISYQIAYKFEKLCKNK